MKALQFITIIVLGMSGVIASPDTSLHSSPEQKRYLITAGIGVPACSIGMTSEKFIEEFGGTVDGRYCVAPDRGVEAEIHDGLIVTLFFHFHSRSRAPFPGAMPEGIGAGSSIDDVISRFGVPEERSESVVSPYGPMPGALDQSIRYPTLGVSFTFYDGKLANVRVYKKRPNQALQTTPMTRSVYEKTIEFGRPQRGV